MLHILTFTVQNIQHPDKSNKNLFSTERINQQKRIYTQGDVNDDAYQYESFPN